MQPLPKIVSARLQSVPRSDHPDADVLTAFAEQSLPHSERALVMEHLSRCGGCREVLALALPEMEAAAPAVVRRPWFTLPSLSMPMLRWGAVAAALIVVASIGIIRYRQNAPQSTVASLELNQEEKTRAASESAIPSSEARTKATVAVSGASKPSPIIAPSARGDSIDRATTSGRSQMSLHALTSVPVAQGAHPSSPVSAQTEAVEVASATAPALPSQMATQQSQLPQGPSESQADQSSPGQSLENRAVVGKAKPAVTPQTVRGLAGSSSAMVQVSPAPPRWMITSAGGLQRSYDQGKTWQDVFVAAASQPGASGLQVEAGEPSAQDQRVAQLKKQNSIASPVFRAISASGTEIWAGAAGGVLYHSVDSGDHWLSAIPSYNGILLTGDILSVQFADSLHGKLATSTSETWTTGDGGQHWSEQ